MKARVVSRGFDVEVVKDSKAGSLAIAMPESIGGAPHQRLQLQQGLGQRKWLRRDDGCRGGITAARSPLMSGKGQLRGRCNASRNRRAESTSEMTGGMCRGWGVLQSAESSTTTLQDRWVRAASRDKERCFRVGLGNCTSKKVLRKIYSKVRYSISPRNP